MYGIQFRWLQDKKQAFRSIKAQMKKYTEAGTSLFVHMSGDVPILQLNTPSWP